MAVGGRASRAPAVRVRCVTEIKTSRSRRTGPVRPTSLSLVRLFNCGGHGNLSLVSPPCLLRFATFAVCGILIAATLPLHSEPAAIADPMVIDPPTEAVINGALHYLAAQQQTNGSWTALGRRGDHPVAITGYVLLAFMAAGNLPEEGDFARQVNAGMQFLLDSIQPDGSYRGVNAGQYMYNHGIATIALAERTGRRALQPCARNWNAR